MPRLEVPLPLAVALSPRQERGYEQLIQAIVQRHVRDLTHHLDRVDRQLPVDKSSWKWLKRREHIDVYRSREPFHADVFAPTPAALSTELMLAPRVQLTKLLCVGTLVGSVDDAMLGSASTAALTMAARSLYIQDEFTQHQVLQEIKTPTLSEPFEYIGLKWALRPSPVATFVDQRDLVYIEATGFHILLRRDGSHERIGYVVYHSVEHPEVPPFAGKGVTRAKMSMCLFFRQTAPEVVQVFGIITTDPGGQLPVKPAAASAASSLLAVSRAMDCARRRKLEWLLKQHGHEKRNKTGRQPRSAKSTWRCGQCARELAGRRTRVECCICHTPVCSRCIKTEKLALGTSPQDLSLVPMPVCTGCVTTACRLENAGPVALDMALAPHDRRLSRTWLLDESNQQSLGSSPPTSYSRRLLPTVHDVRHTPAALKEEGDTSNHDFESYSESSTRQSWSSSTYSDSPIGLGSEQQRMLRMMNSLCLQAEETYSVTLSLSTSTRFEVLEY